ncbi:hypothetical protein [Telmatospirillum siberiense]|uniref:hypothetical protein n=1 Tax=Telmatospirillum siberiense TaxID=382514 RepID=UPI0011AF8560|nr:hypothetical protein [Telmatospirillum siberiense]
MVNFIGVIFTVLGALVAIIAYIWPPAPAVQPPPNVVSPPAATSQTAAATNKTGNEASDQATPPQGDYANKKNLPERTQQSQAKANPYKGLPNTKPLKLVH